MGRMIRKQVYITPQQDVALKRRAAELGVSESELIRRGVTQGIHGRATVPLDHAAWEELLGIIEERGRIVPPTGEKRRWSREEMYDERFNRVPR